MRRSVPERLLLVLGVTGGVVFSLAPFLWFASIGFKPQVEITAIPPGLFPHHISFAALHDAIFKFGLMHFIRNSVIVAGAGSIGR